MLALADVFDLFVHELARLRRRTLAFAGIGARAFECGLRWHIATPRVLAAADALENMSGSELKNKANALPPSDLTRR